MARLFQLKDLYNCLSQMFMWDCSCFDLTKYPETFHAKKDDCVDPDQRFPNRQPEFELI